MSRPVYMNVNVHLCWYVCTYNAFVYTIWLCTVLWGHCWCHIALYTLDWLLCEQADILKSGKKYLLIWNLKSLNNFFPRPSHCFIITKLYTEKSRCMNMQESLCMPENTQTKCLHAKNCPKPTRTAAEFWYTLDDLHPCIMDAKTVDYVTNTHQHINNEFQAHTSCWHEMSPHGQCGSHQTSGKTDPEFGHTAVGQGLPGASGRAAYTEAVLSDTLLFLDHSAPQTTANRESNKKSKCSNDPYSPYLQDFFTDISLT